MMTHLQSPEGQSHWIVLPSGRFHYRVWPAAEPAGPPLLLLHGAADSSTGWRRVGSAISTHGTTAIALDLRGHGRSVKPDPGGYRLRAIADDVAALITALRLDPPVVAGHCWGAAVALVLATGAGGDQPAPALAGLVLEELPPDLSFEFNPSFRHGLMLATSSPRAQVESFTKSWHATWHPLDREACLEELCGFDPAIAASIIRDGAEAGPLLPLLISTTVPASILYADPRTGGMLDEENWNSVDLLRAAHRTVHRLGNMAHDIHRGNYAEYLELVRRFLVSLRPCASDIGGTDGLHAHR